MEQVNNSFSEFLQTLANRSAENIKLNEGDYTGEDGLIYCGKCNTPKQCRPMADVPNFTPKCLCRCETEKRAREEQERKQAEIRLEIEHNRKAGIKDVKILQYTFENDKYPQSETSQRLRKYCKEYKQAFDNNIGLLLWGNVGVGKSYYAGCIANYLLDHGIKVLCTTFPKILNGLFNSDDKNDYINNIVSYPFLIIDDLGTERGTEYAVEQLFTLIDERYKSNKPTVITTNLNPRDMVDVEEIQYKRIYSRITEMCVPLYVKAEAQRTATAKTKAERLAEILRG